MLFISVFRCEIWKSVGTIGEAVNFFEQFPVWNHEAESLVSKATALLSCLIPMSDWYICPRLNEVEEGGIWITLRLSSTFWLLENLKMGYLDLLLDLVYAGQKSTLHRLPNQDHLWDGGHLELWVHIFSVKFNLGRGWGGVGLTRWWIKRC